jgi:hypothetical protein
MLIFTHNMIKYNSYFLIIFVSLCSYTVLTNARINVLNFPLTHLFNSGGKEEGYVFQTVQKHCRYCPKYGDIFLFIITVSDDNLKYNGPRRTNCALTKVAYA